MEKIRYFGGARGGGRTWALINGAKNHPNCVVVCAFESHARQLRKEYPDVKFVSMESYDKLRGTSAAYVWDHYAVERLCAEYERENATLRELRSRAADKGGEHE